MKTTICPSDSSLLAINAVTYSKAFCKALESDLIVVSRPYVSNLFTNPQQVSVYRNQEKKPMPVLAPYGQKAVAEYQPIADPVSQIQQVFTIAGTALSEQADLIIAGVEKDFSFNDIQHQSITNLTKQSRCPVLLIPEGIAFKPFRKIVLVIDHSFNIMHRLPFIARLAETFGAEVSFLQIIREENRTTDHPFFAGSMDLYFTFPYQYTTFYEEINECIPEAIRRFAQQIQADLVITVPNQETTIPYVQATSWHYNEVTAQALSIPLLAIDALPKLPTSSTGYPYN